MADAPFHERGAALLTVLLLVAVMAIVASTALQHLALATRMTGNGASVDQARAYALAGAEMARLRIGDLVSASPGKTTLRGGWLGAPQSLPVPGGAAAARVTDAGNCFNLNSLVSGESEASLKVRPVAVAQFQALMQLVGIDPRDAQRIAAATADWIDSDSAPQPGGAEDEIYAQSPKPYRTANRMMADASELRAVAGVTPAIAARIMPWVCALPDTQMSPINVNTLLPGQAVLFAMLLPGQLSVDQARQLLARRPEDGYGSTVTFWALPAISGMTPLAEVQEQVKLTTRWFQVDVDVDVGGVKVQERALIDAQEQPARIVRLGRSEGA